MELPPLQLAVLAALGVVVGLGLLVRGFAGYREAARIGDTATSRIASLAIGEVRVSGVVEPAEATLVSPLQSARCVYYRSSIERRDDESESTVFSEERAIGFRVRDGSGSVRVFARGARFDVPERYDESTGLLDDRPSGLVLRTASAMAAGATTREEQIAALLTVRPVAPPDAAWQAQAAGAQRRYREARLEPGDQVTVLGSVLPFDQLPDPAGADAGGSSRDPTGALGDPEIAHSIAAAREAGILRATPAEAWGNAAIPGFGVGRPVRAPELDPAAAPAPLAAAEEAERAARIFHIGPHDLILAAGPDAPLVVAAGSPDEAAARHHDQFLIGLLGALLAIASAVGLALVVSGVVA